MSITSISDLPEYQVDKIDEQAARYNKLLSDPDHIWEALGPDGMTGIYPESIRYTGLMTAEQRKEALSTQRAYDDMQALMIGRSFQKGDFTAFARLLWDQLGAYTKYQSEME